MALEEDEYGRRGMDDSYISKQELTWLGSGLDIEAESETWRKLGCPDSIDRARRMGFTLRCWWNEVTGRTGSEIQNFALMFMSNSIKHLCFIYAIVCCSLILSPVFETILETWKRLKSYQKPWEKHFFVVRLRQWFSVKLHIRITWGVLKTCRHQVWPGMWPGGSLFFVLFLFSNALM